MDYPQPYICIFLIKLQYLHYPSPLLNYNSKSYNICTIHYHFWILMAKVTISALSIAINLLPWQSYKKCTIYCQLFLSFSVCLYFSLFVFVVSLSACLPACLNDCLPSCLPGFMHACLPAYLPTWLLAHLTACLPTCLPA